MSTLNSSEDEVLALLGKLAPPSEPPAPPEDQGVEIEDSEEALSGVLEGGGNYQRIGFADPVEMLYAIDDNIRLGRTKLHDWQLADLQFLAADVWDYEDRLKYCLTAANGSGKDAYIIAPFAIWQLTEFIRSRFIGTSKSAHQINTQTNCYIKQLAMRYGKWLIEKGIHPRPFLYRSKPFHIVCQFTGGEVLTFVTDQAENVEGYHPWPDAPKAPLTIVINEAKGVEDQYFDGFSRCTYSRWIEITSPGRKTGRNWEHYDPSIKYPAKREKGKFYSRQVTSYDCPHKSVQSIEEDAVLYGGKDSELFRSKHLAEYTSIGESIILSLDVIDKFLGVPPAIEGVDLAAGLDLSLGGDETVLVTRKGNETKTLDGSRIKDATLLESYLDKLMLNRGLLKNDSKQIGDIVIYTPGTGTPIYTDVGGLGKPIFDHLVKEGWNCIPILNNTPAIGFDKHLYANRGTEIYFTVANFYSRGFIKPLKHKLWREQLGSRKYIRPDNEKIRLQPKAQLKKDADKKALANSAEWESPDYADAWVLAYTNFEPEDLKPKEAPNNNLKRVTQKELVEHLEEQKFNRFKIQGGVPMMRVTQKRLISAAISEYNKTRN